MDKLKHILLTVAILLCTLAASAHDFEVGGIYYNITDTTNKTVEVTYRGSSSNEYLNEYSGDIMVNVGSIVSNTVTIT